MTEDHFLNTVFEEGTLTFLRLAFNIGVEVLPCEAWTTDDDRTNTIVDTSRLCGKVLNKRLDYCVKEFGFLLLISLGSHGTTRFCNCFLYLGLHQCLGLRNDEDVSQALFHGDSDDTANVLLLDHLIKAPHVHRIEIRFDNHDLSWWSDVHCLLLFKRDVSVLSRIGAIDAQ